jgi:hypothetical protein
VALIRCPRVRNVAAAFIIRLAMICCFLYVISRYCIVLLYKRRYKLPVKLGDFTVWRNTRQRNWVNCAVLTGNSEGFRTVLSSRLSPRELRSSIRESHTYSVQFSVQFFYTVKLHSLTLSVWGPLESMGPFRVHGALRNVWGLSECVGHFRVYRALYSVWGPLEFMGHFGVYEALQSV